MRFDEWLKLNTSLSDSSIYKYSHAVATISGEMLGAKVISKPLNEMESTELDIEITKIFFNDAFASKDATGNKMYSNALKQFRYFVSAVCETTDSVGATLVKIVEEDSTLVETEKKSIIMARRGQGQFREKLLQKYGHCIITQIDNPKLLIASHIRPWDVSNNEQRLSVSNGLLLSPTYDKLFDFGLITFDKTGKIYLSSFIGKENEKRLRLVAGMTFDIGYTTAMNDNLQFHNDVLFVK